MKTCDYNHLLLYAKKHYKVTDIVQDIKKILCERSALQTMSDRDVWECLISALEKFCGKDGLRDVLKMLWDNKIPFSSNCSFIHAVEMVLVILSLVTVKDAKGNWLPDTYLGEPDPAILPLKQEGDK
jgi:hypothetical protein